MPFNLNSNPQPKFGCRFCLERCLSTNAINLPPGTCKHFSGQIFWLTVKGYPAYSVLSLAPSSRAPLRQKVDWEIWQCFPRTHLHLLTFQKLPGNEPRHTASWKFKNLLLSYSLSSKNIFCSQRKICYNIFYSPRK